MVVCVFLRISKQELDPNAKKWDVVISVRGVDVVYLPFSLVVESAHPRGCEVKGDGK